MLYTFAKNNIENTEVISESRILYLHKIMYGAHFSNIETSEKLPCEILYFDVTY